MKNAEQMLAETSRTFAAPTMRLPDGLRQAVMGSYLCLRGIDELEDHLHMPLERRRELLSGVSTLLQGPFTAEDFVSLLGEPSDDLPEVTTRLYEWAMLVPPDIASRVWDATATMAVRMTHWTLSGRRVRTGADLDRYSFAVAGAVGLLLADLWAWHDGTQSDRSQAVAFGRGLQLVNIYRDQSEDAEIGLSYLPEGWTEWDLLGHAVAHLSVGDQYVRSLRPGPARSFCATTLSFSWAAVDAAVGGPLLTRELVSALTERAHASGTVGDHSQLIAAVERRRHLAPGPPTYP